MKKFKFILPILFILILIGGFITFNPKINILSIDKKEVYDDYHSLESFLTDIRIAAPTKGENGYLVYKYAPYSLSLRFEETKTHQFENSGQYKYTLPSGFDFSSMDQEGYLTITVDTLSGKVDVPGNHYELRDGVIYFKWSEDESVQQLFAAENAYFYITFDAYFNNSEDQDILFGDKKVTIIPLDNYVEIEKTASTTDTGINYTLSITSTGYNKDVKITDELLSSDLKYTLGTFYGETNDPDKPLLDMSSLNIEDDNFDLTIPLLKHGDVITIGYSTAYDVSKLALDESTGDYVSGQLKNTAKVTTKDDKTGQIASKTTTISIKPKLFKYGGTLREKQEGKDIVDWTIVLNLERNIDYSGFEVTDYIDLSKASVYGDGITVKILNEMYQVEKEIAVPYSELIGEDASYLWKYTLPDDGSIDYNKTVEISYTTEIDNTGITEKTPINNSAELLANDHIYESHNTYMIEPEAEDMLSLSKEVSNIDMDNMEITWKITINVPKEGLNENNSVLNEQLPTYDNWITGETYRDTLIDLKVTGLLEGESYNNIYDSDKNSIDIYFYKNEDLEYGLKSSTAPRSVVITVKTKIDEIWYDKSRTDTNLRTHSNYVRIGDLTKTANVEIKARPKKAITKTLESEGEKQIDGVNYPTYKYKLVLSGFDEGIKIEDYFDTSIFKVYYDRNDYSFDSDFVLCGGDINGQYNCEYYYDSQRGLDYEENANGLLIDIPKERIQKNGDEYYEVYSLTYQLIPKDITALHKLKSLAAKDGGTYTFNNTAYWTDGEKTVSNKAKANYSYKAIEKNVNGTVTVNDKLHFTINLNPDSLLMNDGNDIEINDDYNNLDIVYDSFTITPSTGAKVSNEDHTLKISVPDGVATTIEYDAKPQFGYERNVIYNNIASFKDYSATRQELVTRDTSGGGGASLDNIRILKVDGNNILNPISDVTFALYDSNKEPVVGNNGEVTVTTNEEGTAVIYGNGTGGDGWSLIPGNKYYIKEVNTPSGYQKDDNYYAFQLSTDGVSDKTNDIYNPGDTMLVENTPLPPEPETVGLTVSKIWEDNDDQDGLRPESVTMQLNTGETVVLNQGNNWTNYIDGLPKYDENNNLIEYYWTETNIPDTYTMSDKMVVGYSTIITNEHVPETTDISIKKVWHDSDDQDGLRPDDLTINLLADGVPTDYNAVLDDSNNWYKEINDLPKYKDGREIEYTWVEPTVSGYTSEINEGADTVITNIHEPETKEVTIMKVWENDTASSMRPSSLTFDLKADGVVIDQVTLTEADGWVMTINDLAKNSDGHEIEYSWSEPRVNGYVLTDTQKIGDVTTFTNTYVNKSDGFTIKKVDRNNSDKFLSGANFSLYEVAVDANGVILDKTLAGFGVTNPRGEIEFNEISIFSSVGSEGTYGKLYYLEETNPPQGYEKTEDDNFPEYFIVYENGNVVAQSTAFDFDNMVTLANSIDVRIFATGEALTATNTASSKTVTVKKVWDDNENQDDLRPDSLTIKLFADGVDTNKTVTLKESNGWTDSISGLAKYQGDGETEINYTWKEDEINGYSSTTSTDGDVTTITNTHIPETTEATIMKVWDDNDDVAQVRPESITVNLLADGETIYTTSLVEEYDWMYTKSDLPKYANGHEIVYSWVENNVDNYIKTNETKLGTITSITNTCLDKKGKISIKKVDSIDEEQLIAGAQLVLYEVILDNNYHIADNIEKYSVTTENDKLAEFNNLSMFSKVSDQLIYGKLYYLEETVFPDGYTQKTGDKKLNYFVVSDTEGNDAALEFINNIESANDITINNLENDEVFTMTNSLETKSVSVQKVWKDNNNQDDLRPRSLTVNLLANGKSTGKSVTLNEANNWTDSIDDIPMYGEGGLIEYTWEEPAVSGYSRNTTTNGTHTTITNTHTSEKTSLTINKTWEDNNNQDGIRPNKVNVNILANGTVVKTVEVNSNNNWSTTVSDLDKYSGGNLINYTISEQSISGYTPTINGNNITNKHTPEKTTFKVNKVWNDNNNANGARPSSIKVHLYADGTEIDSKDLNANGNWEYTFTNLDKYRSGGQAIIYTVSEDTIPEYTTSINNGTITNNYNPTKTSYTVNKEWNDDNDRDKKRPNSIRVSLLANGEVVQTINLLASEGWTHTFTDLNKYKNNNEIIYSVREESSVEGYTSKTTNNTIVNSHNPEVINISGNKTWEDDNDKYNKRPDKIRVCLYADGSEKECKEVKEDNGKWTYSFTDLFKYNNGVLINYTIVEDAVEGYSSNVDGYNIINTLTKQDDKDKGKGNNKDNIINPKTSSTLAIILLTLTLLVTGIIIGRKRSININ